MVNFHSDIRKSGNVCIVSVAVQVKMKFCLSSMKNHCNFQDVIQTESARFLLFWIDSATLRTETVINFFATMIECAVLPVYCVRKLMAKQNKLVNNKKEFYLT